MPILQGHNSNQYSLSMNPAYTQSPDQPRDQSSVLIVDDNPNNLKVLEQVLKSAGYSVRPALNAEMALRAIRARHPELILLDVRMPGMDGYELCQLLKADAATQDIPVIFISALQEMDDKVQAFKVGGIDYIVKPFQAEEVLTRVHTHLELARVRRVLARSNERLEQQVLQRTAELERLMQQEHLLRELMSLSHNQFADPAYLELVLAYLAKNLDWDMTTHASVLLLQERKGPDSFLSMAAQLGFDDEETDLLEQMELKDCDAPLDQINELASALIRDESTEHLQCQVLYTGSDAIGLFLVRLPKPDALPKRLLEQLAEVLAMGIARRQADERLAWQAYHDVLTELPNRRLLEDDLERAVETSSKEHSLCGLLLIGLDRFKLHNDTLGHGAGDAMLKVIAERLWANTFGNDLVYRWGGDEFVILMRTMGQHEAHAAQYAQNNARLMAEKIGEPILLDGQEIRLTASMGIAFYPSDAANGSELLKHVELAMTKAKESGRNSMHFFRPQMQSEAERRIYLEKEMRLGLARDEFVIYLQPQVNSQGQLVGAEALVRWLHPERGLIPPGNFIPAAEESGLILELGKVVLRQACRWLGKASSQASNLPIISVNLSPRQFFEQDFVESIQMVLEEEKVDPGLLELEITEGLLLKDVDTAIEKMCQLKELGLKFSLDDFGTGYSSLSYLRRLPVDQIKIDQSFVRGVHQDERNSAIVRSIISLANNLGMTTIAEGVEVLEELGFLQDAGCEQFQGYYFSKPIPIAEFEKTWLTSPT